uniref:PDZ domain-containing protein n=1 Tax=Plectus sambesii TaxID=2011161 RepID=A0A914VM12_9BILA
MQTIVRDASHRPTTHLLQHTPNSLSFPANLARYHQRAPGHGYGAVIQRGPSSSYHQLIVDQQYQPTYAPPQSDRGYYFGEQADNVGYYEARSPSPPMSLCRWCWTTICCCCPSWCCSANRGQTMPWSSFRRRSQDDKAQEQRRHGNISEEVYQKIREVDQQSSTLTAAGVQGLSARVLNKYEYRQDLVDGTPEIHVCQLVEIIKKPGQSLGLYLREGNGVERPTGVFASRFGDNSELQRYGDIVRPGDEILEVNNVQVSHMNIDDVVLILSIPRRLLLRVRFVKNRREPAWLSFDDGDSSRSARPDHSRPVVVFKKVASAAANSNSATPAISREDSHESGFGDEGQGPTPTAKTSLGKRARQQLVEMQQLQQGSSSTGAASNAHSATMPRPTVRSIDIQQQPSTSTAAATGQYAPSPSMSRAARTLSPRETFALHQPRLLDSHGQPMLDNDTVSRTARVPPPKLYGTVRRAESFNPTISMAQSVVGTLSRSSTHAAPSVSMFSPRSVASDSLMDYQRTFQPPPPPLPPPLNPYAVNPRGPAPPVPPKPAIRRPIGSSSVYERQMQLNAYKSNSLPRRRPTAATRSVKWRNDVTGEGAGVGAVPTDMSTDSDGAISAPEFAMSPTYGGGYATLRGMFPYVYKLKSARAPEPVRATSHRSSN